MAKDLGPFRHWSAKPASQWSETTPPELLFWSSYSLNRQNSRSVCWGKYLWECLTSDCIAIPSDVDSLRLFCDVEHDDCSLRTWTSPSRRSTFASSEVLVSDFISLLLSCQGWQERMWRRCQRRQLSGRLYPISRRHKAPCRCIRAYLHLSS